MPQDVGQAISVQVFQPRGGWGLPIKSMKDNPSFPESGIFVCYFLTH
jgi:hypothetical protein